MGTGSPKLTSKLQIFPIERMEPVSIGGVAVRTKKLGFKVACIVMLVALFSVIGVVSYLFASSKPAQSPSDPKEGVQYKAISTDGEMAPVELAGQNELGEADVLEIFKSAAAQCGLSSPTDSGIIVSEVLDPVLATNVWKASDDRCAVSIRANDCRMMNVQNLGPYDDPSLSVIAISEDAARSKAQALLGELQGLENSANAKLNGIGEAFPTYSIGSVARSDLTGVDMWTIDFNRVSSSGIPYYRQAESVLLRADGILISFVRNEPAECADTKPVISEQDAIAVCSDMISQAISRFKQSPYSASPDGSNPPDQMTVPTSADLVYVVPNWYYSAELSKQAQAGQMPIIEQQNHLTWILNVPGLMEVWVDAMTGEIIGGNMRR